MMELNGVIVDSERDHFSNAAVWSRQRFAGVLFSLAPITATAWYHKKLSEYELQSLSVAEVVSGPRNLPTPLTFRLCCGKPVLGI